MGVVVVIAYGVLAAAVVAGGVVLARMVWRGFGRRERKPVARAAHDRRRGTAPVAWERRVRSRRLEDLARSFLEGFEGREGAGTR